MKTTKRLITWLLVFVIAVSMVSIPAYAAEPEAGNVVQETIVESENMRGNPYAPNASAWTLGNGSWRVSWSNFPAAPNFGTIRVSVDGFEQKLYKSGSGYTDIVGTTVSILGWY